MNGTADRLHGNTARGRRKARRLVPAAIGFAAVMLVITAVALANFVISGSIDGNTVNYSVFGAIPNSDYTVTITHDDTQQSNSYAEQSNEDGEFDGSGCPGNSQINSGDTVTIGVYDENDKLVGSKTIRKGPETTDEGAPWWAYTGVGTIIWWVT